jgi:hypothetical protein
VKDLFGSIAGLAVGSVSPRGRAFVLFFLAREETLDTGAHCDVEECWKGGG